MKLFLFAFFALSSVSVFCQDSSYTVSGINYTGKNLYIINNPTGENEYCILQIWLNNSLVIRNSTSGAIELSVNDVPVNDSLHIKIVHRNSCK